MLEFNVRFGDPETQVVLPRWDGDVADVLASAAAGSLGGRPDVSEPSAAVTVVAAAEGYPASPRTGEPIEGIEAAAAMDGVEVYAAGVGRDSYGRLATAGGRVLAVTGVAPDVAEARARAYQGRRGHQLAGHELPPRHRRTTTKGRGGNPVKVAVLMGSKSDQERMAAALSILAEFGVEATEHVMSAHRTRRWCRPSPAGPATTATACSSAAPAWPPTSPGRWPATPRCR